MDGGTIIPIQNMIYEIRGQKVMLDSDLAGLYEVEVKILNQAVKRNFNRFPSDFMFQLSQEEWDNLRSQIVTSSSYHGGRRYMPYVFTEQGVAMLAAIISSQKAIDVNIRIMRAFVQLRHFVVSQTGTSEQIAELRRLLLLHIENTENKFSEHDKSIRQIAQVLNNLIMQPKTTGKIGF